MLGRIMTLLLFLLGGLVFKDVSGSQVENGRFAMVNFLCKLDHARGCPEMWLKVISGYVCDGVSVSAPCSQALGL